MRLAVSESVPMQVCETEQVMTAGNSVISTPTKSPKQKQLDSGYLWQESLNLVQQSLQLQAISYKQTAQFLSPKLIAGEDSDIEQGVLRGKRMILT